MKSVSLAHFKSLLQGLETFGSDAAERSPARSYRVPQEPSRHLHNSIRVAELETVAEYPKAVLYLLGPL
ncbi:MAG: hypothetical protein II954_10315, partial [Synergistaceae bacterium]|nr:hypothetical protein [Synergistaceae bacterium]